jgi:hypothetical protein
MVTPIQKGKSLERAVRSVEAAILQAAPGYSEKTFTIESKKIVIVKGVRHEIHVWVGIDLGKGYRALFIFECKNWEESVGKNEIIVFSEKVKATRAQSGFFVAKSFTRDAEAQAQEHPRITLLLAKEYDIESTRLPYECHVLTQEETRAGFILRELGTRENERRVPIDPVNAKATLRGEVIDFDRYVREWIVDACNERLASFPSGVTPNGVHELQARVERQFDREEFYVNDKEIESASLSIDFKVRITRPAVISHFEVQSRGRVVSLAPVMIGQVGPIAIDFVGTT